MLRRLVAVLALIALLAPPMTAGAQAFRGGRGGFGGHGGGFAGPGGFARAAGFPGPGAGGMGPRGGYIGPNVYGEPMVRRGPGPAMAPFGRPPGGSGYMRGQYLPPEARGEVISDFGLYHLRRPPRGYYWYRAGGDFVLAATASGMIFDVVPGDGY